MAITAQVDPANGLGKEIIDARTAVSATRSILKALDAHPIHAVVAKMKRMRNPDDDTSADNYADIAIAAGVQGADAAAKNASAQVMYVEMEALSGHYNNSAATLGTISDQDAKVLAIVGPK